MVEGHSCEVGEGGEEGSVRIRDEEEDEFRIQEEAKVSPYKNRFIHYSRFEQKISE